MQATKRAKWLPAPPSLAGRHGLPLLSLINRVIQSGQRAAPERQQAFAVLSLGSLTSRSSLLYSRSSWPLALAVRVNPALSAGRAHLGVSLSSG